MKNLLISFVFLSVILVVRSDNVCDAETEDCVKYFYCSKNFTSTTPLVKCGEKSICCEKEENMLKLKMPTCGLQNSEDSLKSLKLPWSVSIEVNEKQICSGSLINSQVVITTGSCVSGKTPETLNLKLGSWTAGGKFGFEEKRKAVKVIMHPGFVDGQSNDDVALIVLDSPSSNNAFINPICIPSDDEDFNGKSCVLLGFEEKTASKMNVEDMKIAPCQNFPKLAALIPKHSLCTEKNSEMTLSSVGAGLVCPFDDKTKDAYQLAGIFVHGTDITPSLYVKVADYRDWIDEKMTELKIDNESYVYDPTASRFVDFGIIKNWSLNFLQKAEVWFTEKIIDPFKTRGDSKNDQAKMQKSIETIQTQLNNLTEILSKVLQTQTENRVEEDNDS